MRTTFILFFISCSICFSQKRQSKGDQFFFQYAYKKAIVAYEEDLSKGYLNAIQYLNLADSYYQIGEYEKANDAYLSVFSDDNYLDSIMSTNRFNKMLQSLGKTGETIMIDNFLKSNQDVFSNELLENSKFNKELLSSAVTNSGLDYKIFNLNSNSDQGDFSPAFYQDKLLFTSGRPKTKKQIFSPSGQVYLDIFEGTPDSEGQLSNATKFIGIKDSDFHKATPYFAQELNSLIYVLSNTSEGELLFDDNGKNALAIGMKPENGEFRFLLRDLSTSFYYPFYDADSGKLFFSAKFDDGYGGTDIYFVYTNNGQIMSAPINLGPRINSPGNEIAPYVFENSLYFSSDVFYGIGGMDIYKSNFESEDSFSIPVNLGKEINSEKDDFGFIIKNRGNGLLGYFSSNREGGKGDDDIYGFLVDQKPGLKTLTLRGKVIEPYGNRKVIANSTVRLLNSDGSIISEVTSNEDGMYRFEIPWREDVILQASKERYSLYTKKMVVVTGDEQETTFDVDVELSLYDDLVEEKEEQTVIKLRKFFFEKGKTTITPEIAIELDKVVAAVSSFPNIQLRIETHTDSRGGSSTNFRLTQKRSDAIKKYLLDNGVSGTNILYSIGYGEDKIINNCTNGVFCLEMLHKQNQRSLIVVLNDNVLFQ
ncbi:OmpA family protein [Croceitalea sp. MTPC9]|uniref:OmpA family protein n=1 Tax=unclassified Croceitalea TaxID=2632280 RepID=UPI002B38B32A|nr:OmpA family protein [Croceitalea sp. MTPC6]GMN17340.1 OmpA family protein [Croceitalea sp. MTPC9]